MRMVAPFYRNARCGFLSRQSLGFCRQRLPDALLPIVGGLVLGFAAFDVDGDLHGGAFRHFFAAVAVEDEVVQLKAAFVFAQTGADGDVLAKARRTDVLRFNWATGQA